MSFLELDIELQKDEPSFKYSSIVIDRLVFTNDSAERGVKLTSDFIDTAKIEDNFQNVLQVVEDQRFKNPNIRKINSSKEYIFITISKIRFSFSINKQTNQE